MYTYACMCDIDVHFWNSMCHQQARQGEILTHTLPNTLTSATEMDWLHTIVNEQMSRDQQQKAVRMRMWLPDHKNYAGCTYE